MRHTRAWIVVLVSSATAMAEDFHCTGKAVVPAFAQGTGTFPGRGCDPSDPSYSGGNCAFGVGVWAIGANSLTHAGVPVWAAGSLNASLSDRSNALTGLCVDSFSGTESSIALTMTSPLEHDVKLCATLTRGGSDGCAHVTVGFSTAGALLPCTSQDNWTDATLCDFTFGSPAELNCPSGSAVIPPSFVQPPVLVTPANALDVSMPRLGGLRVTGLYQTFMADIAQEVLCAKSFTLVEDNRADELTRWEVLYGDASVADAAPVGCMTFLRLGRTVAFAERFVGNNDMDVSCGGPAVHTHDSLCCWNWTYSVNNAADGSSVKGLLNYFPAHWTPDDNTSGGTSSAGISITVIAATTVGVLLAIAVVVIVWLFARQRRLMRALAAANEAESGVRDELLMAPEEANTGVHVKGIVKGSINEA